MRGNDPKSWEKLLQLLDERMQLNLLEHLQKVVGYHLEDGTLFLEPVSTKEADFLSRPSIIQTLSLFASEACKVSTVKVKAPNH